MNILITSLIFLFALAQYSNSQSNSKRYYSKSTPLLGQVIFSKDGSKMFSWNSIGGTIFNTQTGLITGNLENSYEPKGGSGSSWKGNFLFLRAPTFSDDNKYIYHFDEGVGILIWDAIERKLSTTIGVSELSQKLERYSSTNDIESNFEYCVFSSEPLSGSDGTRKIKLFDIAQRKIIREMPGTLQHKREVRALRIDSKNKQIATGDDAGNVFIWELNTDRVVELSRLSEEMRVRYCFFDSEGGKIVVFYDNYDMSNKKMGVFDVKTGERIYFTDFWGTSHADTSLMKECNAVIVRADSLVEILNVTNGKVTSFSMQGYSLQTTNIKSTISLDNRFYAVLKSNSTVDIYNVLEKRLLCTVRLDTERVQHYLQKSQLVFNPNGTELIVTNPAFCYSIDVKKGVFTKKVNGLASYPVKVDFTQRERCAFVKNGAKMGFLYDFKEGRYILENIWDRARYCDYHKKKNLLVINVKNTDTLAFYNILSGELVKEIDVNVDSIKDVQFNKVGNHIMIFQWNGKVQVWDLEKNSFLYEYKLIADQIRRIVYSDDNNRCLVFGSSGVTMFNTNDGKKIASFTGLDPFSNVRMTSNGDKLISLNAVYDGNTGKLIKRMALGDDSETYEMIEFGAFLNDGKRAVTGSQDKLFIWNVGSGSLLKKISYNKDGGYVQEFELSADNKTYTLLKSSGLPQLQVCSFEDGSVIVNGIVQLEGISGYAVDIEQESIITVGRSVSFRMWTPYFNSTTTVHEDEDVVKYNSNYNDEIPFKLIPNITNSDFQVHFNEKNEIDCPFEVYSSTGELVQRGVIEKENETAIISVNNLTSGIYLFVTDIAGRKYQEKFIINK